MLKKTTGIVIGYTKYRETSIITKIFTRELGLKSYVVNGVRSNKSSSKVALFQPLTLVDLVVYDKENANIHRISEIKSDISFQRIPFDFIRSGISMFMAEILGKVVFDNYQNELLFDHLKNQILALDAELYQPGLFALHFLIGTSRYLGFEPEDANDFFLQLPVDQSSSNYTKKSLFLNQILESEPHSPTEVPGNIKRQLLDDWILFYKIHIDGFGEIKSLSVLRTLLA
ncbi:DNA repair protein RecO [Cyclobacterium amurskyense]|jgi:DNA repair protein RecO (recombination protein O)|uniref:DNA repair protein RecO n=1 Tax=Cyclobacterium amurskyense TaxID=320787 RepID=A0A0H4PN09_9BACT|nr:DNA repair protein RecO [Cyclobacterium amurskyense]AKP49647.1 DNA repair protein RecO [Cyclobacterium amurskyense]|tara:strand:- start:431 stop:1117 length:687 start_codon:yes stop_codon:yes gene_type:complete